MSFTQCEEVTSSLAPKPSMMIPTPKQFVNATLGKINLKGAAGERVGTITPFWSHEVMHWAIQERLGVWNGIVLGWSHGMHASNRKRAARKRGREAEKQ
jgi:17beta-estradiol 17-dehydrogenase / very-long-chain 3-oxoacyl-CoA reductase